MEKSYRVDQVDVTAAIISSKNWQGQADSITEDSTDTELATAIEDWGITQGYINCLKQLDIIDRFEYENLSRKQLLIRSKLQEKRTQGTANTKESM